MSLVDFSSIEATCREQRASFESAQPFSHTIIDNFLPADVADKVLAEFEVVSAGWAHYHHYNEKKMALRDVSKMGNITRAVFDDLQSQRFVASMEALSGVQNLLPDPQLDGAGLHQIMPGGFLNIHADFMSHTTQPTWSRQLNLLLYLNKDWRPEYNGALELWDEDMKTMARSIEPVFNRCVIFRTSATAFHGHPNRLSCPAGMSRKSIALYYFRDEKAVNDLQPTDYRAVPTDPLYKRLLIAADRQILWAYSFLKRKGILTDSMVEKLLRRF